MIFTIDDIKKNCPNAYVELPSSLRSIRDLFVTFEYQTDASGKVSVLKTKNVDSIGLYLYKELGNNGIMLNGLAYYKNCFDSRSFIFYQILKSLAVNNGQEIDAFYDSMRLKDREKAKITLQELIVKYDEIYNSQSFRNAITKYLFGQKKESIANECVRIADMINSYFQTKNISLYGDKIVRVVNAITDTDGLIIKEKDQSEIFYMLVGQKSLVCANTDDFIKAKSYLRSGLPIAEIYELTGWFFNNLDKKWRYQISDSESKLMDYVIDMDNEKNNQFINSSLKKEVATNDIIRMVSGALPFSKDVLNNMPFLPQILKHDELYKNYPDLSFTKCVYLKVDSDEYKFYAQKDFIVICSNTNWDKHNILLHETQHIIQKIEGFSKGGNPFLASIGISSPQSLRDFFGYSIEVNNIIKSTKSETSVKAFLEKNNIQFDEDLAMSFIQNYATSIKTDKELAENLLTGFTNIFESQYASELLENIQKASNILIKGFEFRDAYTGGGYTDKEAQLIRFRAYESILGEIEARYTQKTALLSSDEQKRFLPISAEVIEDKDIIIYTDNYEIKKTKNKDFSAAIEKYKDSESDLHNKYIIHLKNTRKAQPIVHELAHILYDDFSNYQDLFSQFVNECNSKKIEIDLEEYFVQCVLSYLKSKPDVFTNIAEEVESTDKSQFVDIYAERVFNAVDMDIYDIEKAKKYLEFLKLVRDYAENK